MDVFSNIAIQETLTILELRVHRFKYSQGSPEPGGGWRVSTGDVEGGGGNIFSPGGSHGGTRLGEKGSVPRCWRGAPGM